MNGVEELRILCRHRVARLEADNLPVRRPGRLGAWLYGLAWVLFLLAQYRVFVHLRLYLSQPQPGIWYFISSDTLVFDAVYQDLFVDGFHWAGWHVSHSPQFIEMLWYFALRFATGGAMPAHLLHALLVPTLVAVAFQIVLRSLSPAAPPRELAIMLLAAGALPLLYVRGIALDLIAYFWVARHVSSLSMDLVCLALLLRLLPRARTLPALGLGLFATLGTAADQAFLAEFTLPMLGTLAVLGWGAKALNRRAVVVLWGTLALSTLLGIALFRLISPRSTLQATLTLRPGLLAESMSRLGRDLLFDWPVRRWSVIAVLALAGAAVAATPPLLRRLRRGEARGEEPRLLALIVYAPFSLLTVLGGIVALGRPVNTPGYLRQLAWVYTMALLGLGLIGVWLSRRARDAGKDLVPAACAFGFAGALAAGWQSLPRGTRPISAFYPALTACLDGLGDARGIQYGVADYWLARYNNVFSRRGLRLYAMSPNFTPYTDSNNVEWLLGGVGARHHDRPGYSFVLLGEWEPRPGGLQRRGAVERFGEPKEVAECAGWRVLLYDPESLDARLKPIFRSATEVRIYYRSQGYALP